MKNRVMIRDGWTGRWFTGEHPIFHLNSLFGNNQNNDIEQWQPSWSNNLRGMVPSVGRWCRLARGRRLCCCSRQRCCSAFADTAAGKLLIMFMMIAWYSWGCSAFEGISTGNCIILLMMIILMMIVLIMIVLIMIVLMMIVVTMTMVLCTVDAIQSL